MGAVGAEAGAGEEALAGVRRVSGPAWPHALNESNEAPSNEPAAVMAAKRDATLECCFNMRGF